MGSPSHSSSVNTPHTQGRHPSLPYLPSHHQFPAESFLPSDSQCSCLSVPTAPAPIQASSSSLGPHPVPPLLTALPALWLPCASASGSSPERSGLSHPSSLIFSPPRSFCCPHKALMVAQTPSALCSFVPQMLVHPCPCPASDHAWKTLSLSHPGNPAHPSRTSSNGPSSRKASLMPSGRS